MAEVLDMSGLHASQVNKKFNGVTLGLFTIVLATVWSFAASGLVIGVYAGGLPVLIWSSLFVGLLLSILVLSFAEFGSAYPSVAGCVVIATKLGGPTYGHICGYLTGVLHALASFITPACIVTSHAPFIATIAMVMNPDWEPKKWQVFLIYQAISFVTVMICLRGSRSLDLVATVGSFFLFALFFSAIGILLGCPDKLAPADLVWFKTRNFTGWPDGLAYLIGASAPLAGYGPTHWVLNMAEDVKNPRRAMPIAFLIQQIGNVLTLFTFFVIIGYGVGDKWELIIESRYLAHMAAVIETATNSKAGTAAFLSILITLSIVSAASYMSAAIRLIHGFARTGAFPFSEWLSVYDVSLQLPKNILKVLFGVNVLIGFLMLGNSSAIITMIGAATLLFTVGYMPMFFAYLVTGGRYLGTQGWFRLPRRVSLAVAGFNALSVVAQAVLLCLPPFKPITLENMNWASAVAGSLLVFLFVSFWFYGKKRYRPNEDLITRGQEVQGSEESGVRLSGKLVEVKGEGFAA